MGPALGPPPAPSDVSRQSREGPLEALLETKLRSPGRDLRDLLSNRLSRLARASRRSCLWPIERSPPQGLFRSFGSRRRSACFGGSSRERRAPAMRPGGPRADLNWNEFQVTLGPRSEIPRPRDRPGSRGPQRLWRADAVPCILPQSNRPARGRPRDALPSSLRDSSRASTTSFGPFAKGWTPPSRQDPCLPNKPGQTPCHLDRLSGAHGDPTPLGPAGAS